MNVVIITHEVRDAHNKNIRYDDECYRNVSYFRADNGTSGDTMDEDTYDRLCMEYVERMYRVMLDNALDDLDEFGGRVVYHNIDEENRFAFVRYIVADESMIYDKVELVDAEEILVKDKDYE